MTRERKEEAKAHRAVWRDADGHLFHCHGMCWLVGEGRWAVLYRAADGHDDALPTLYALAVREFHEKFSKIYDPKDSAWDRVVPAEKDQKLYL